MTTRGPGAQWRRWVLARPRIALLTLLPRIDARLTVLATLVAALQAAVAVGMALTLGRVIQAVPNATDSRLLFWTAVLGALFVVQHTLVPVLDYVAGRLGRKADGYLCEQLMQVLLAPVGIAHLEDPRILRLRRSAQGVGEGQHTPAGAVTGSLRNLGTWLTVLSLSVVVGFFSSWPLALLITAFLVPVRSMLVARITRDALHTTGNTDDLRRADYIRTLSLTAAAAKELRIFGMSDWSLARFRRHWTAAMREIWSERQGRTNRPWAWSVPWGVVLVVVFVVTAHDVVRGAMTLPAAVTVVQAAIGASSVWVSYDDVQIAYGAAAVPPLLELRRLLPPEVARPAADDAGPEVARRAADDAGSAPCGADIRFDRVGFRYPGADREVLRELTLTIPAGRSLAVVGLNAAGKTTLVKLLTRLYEPCSGKITVGGTDLREIPVGHWRRRIAVVFQDFVRYRLPAADNVGFGRLDLAEDHIALDAAALRAGADGVVRRLDQGWGTVLSKEFAAGTDLSGGQWQRVALARAMLALAGGADVLVLDEPTASLDVKAELELFDRLVEVTRGITTILISHRFSTVRRADLICVLSAGEIVEVGDHDELLAMDGHYARMYRRQASRFTTGTQARPA